ncbi:hypothetical protein HDU86_007925 [Geranomyces michiganensis]|nr:hypothetical protein HDU86_007925 [Geranomyces michiganensis]
MSEGYNPPAQNSSCRRGSLWADESAEAVNTIDEELGNIANTGFQRATLTQPNTRGASLWKDDDLGNSEVYSEPPSPPLPFDSQTQQPFPAPSSNDHTPFPPSLYDSEEHSEPPSPLLTGRYAKAFPTPNDDPSTTTGPRPGFLTGKHAKALPQPGYSKTPSIFADEEVDTDDMPFNNDDDDADDDYDSDYPGGRPFAFQDQESDTCYPPPTAPAANHARSGVSASESRRSSLIDKRGNTTDKRCGNTLERRGGGGNSRGNTLERREESRKSQASRNEGGYPVAVLANPALLASLGRYRQNSSNGSGSHKNSRGSITSGGLTARHSPDEMANADDIPDTWNHMLSTPLQPPQPRPRRLSAGCTGDRLSLSLNRNSVTGSGFSLDSFQPHGAPAVNTPAPAKSKRPRAGSETGRSRASSVADDAQKDRIFHENILSRGSTQESSLNSFTGYLNMLLTRETAAAPPTFKKDGFRKWFGPWLSRTVLSIKGMVLLLFLSSILACCLFLGYYQAANDRYTLEMLIKYLQLSSAHGIRSDILKRATTIENFSKGVWTAASLSQPGAAIWSSIIATDVPDQYLTQNALAAPYTGSIFGAEVYAPNVILRWSAPNSTHTLEDFYDFDGNPLSNMPSAAYPNYADQPWVSMLFPLPREKADLGHWTGVILYNGDLYITFAVPIYAADNATIQYTMGGDFTLDYLSTITAEYKAADPLLPEIVILANDGFVVASTFPHADVITTPPNGGDPVLALAANSPTHALRSANALLLAATSDNTYKTLTQPIVTQLQTGDTGGSGAMFVTALPCTSETGIRLIVLQFQRRATIFDAIDAAGNTTALVIAAFVVGILLVTMLLLHWITKPLLDIQQAMNELFLNHGREAEEESIRRRTTTTSEKQQRPAGEPSVQATAQMDEDTELGIARHAASPAKKPPPAGKGAAAKARGGRFSRLKQLSRLSEISDLQISFLKMQEAIRAFERFVPPVVVQRIIARERKAKELYVEKKEVAIFFSDIQDFTAIVERLPSEVLISMLAQYFEEMTRAIERSQGVLSDFIGDGMMVFWNAPKQLDDFPTRALECALDQQARVNRLNDAFRSQGWPELIVRMALHVGTVHAGNVGSRHRMKLGIVGDNVNLASRLEGLNKRYSSRIIISDDCRRALRRPETYLMRPLESVILKGRSQSVDVYEVFGPLAAQPSRTVQMVQEYGVVHQMVAAINPQRSAKRDKDTVAAACDAYNATYPKDQMGQLLREKVARGTFGQPLSISKEMKL